LLPFDFGEPSVHALAWAVDLQRSVDGPPIQMVHAIDSRPAVASEGPPMITMPGPSDLRGLETRMREAARRAGGSAIVEIHAEPFAVGDILLDLAKKRNADLIVMGTHGRKGLERLLLGGVATHVLRRAECPVVTIHHPHAT
jgi:nucleotide-binding universal stress UspA family protein